MEEDGVDRACGMHIREVKGSRVLVANLME
jgi:hypothetical protein